MGKHESKVPPIASSPAEWALNKVPDRVEFSEDSHLASFDDHEVTRVGGHDHGHITSLVMGFAQFPEHPGETFVLMQIEIEGVWLPISLVDTPEHMKHICTEVLHAIEDVDSSIEAFRQAQEATDNDEGMSA